MSAEVTLCLKKCVYTYVCVYICVCVCVCVYRCVFQINTIYDLSSKYPLPHFLCALCPLSNQLWNINQIFMMF